MPMEAKAEKVSIDRDLLNEIRDHLTSLHACKGLLDSLQIMSACTDILDQSDAAFENMDNIRTETLRMVWNLIDDVSDVLLSRLQGAIDKADEAKEG